MNDYKTIFNRLLSIIIHPLIAFVITPLNGLLFGTLLAIKSADFSWQSITIWFSFLVLVFLQEKLFDKTNKMKKIVKIITMIITNVLTLIPLIYFWNNFNHQICYLALIILLLNHVQLAVTDTSHGLYYYHVIFKTISFYGIGNFIAYYILAGAVPANFLTIIIPVFLLALSLVNIKQKKLTDNSLLKTNYANYPIQTTLQFLLGILPLLVYIIFFVHYHNHFTLIGMIFVSLTLILFLYIKLAAKKSLSQKQYLTALQWYLFWFILTYTICYTI